MNFKFDSKNIITNNDEISYEYFIERLFEIYLDCNREVYYAEIFIPFFRMCAPAGTKIVPIFDDRNPGKEAEEEGKLERRMKTICACSESGKYIVPDFIFTPIEYSFDNPCKPYIMVETKKPIFLQNGKYYRSLSDYISENEEELKCEIRSSGTIIFTDGITWMFLELDKNDNIVESEKYKTVEFVEKFESYYKANRIEIKKKQTEVDLSIIGADKIIVEAEPSEWANIKCMIKELIEEKKTERSICKCYYENV